ncbi:MAG: glycosyltransferase [Nanobdellota archaeon]
MTTTKQNACAFTIIARNYLPQARVLAESWHRHHPDVPFYIFVLDRTDGLTSEHASFFSPEELTTLTQKEIRTLSFKYQLIEFATAIKPFVISHLFDKGVEQTIYLDPDILIYAPLKKVFSELSSKDIVLTPHLTQPMDSVDARLPKNKLFTASESSILWTGVYNLGFIALRNTENTSRFISWWSQKLYDDCRRDSQIFLDQKWIDFVPTFFKKVSVIMDKGYNVAYWNLYERPITQADNVTYVDGSPLVFYHFSGFNPDLPSVVSCHQNRYDFQLIGPELTALFKDYAKRLYKAGFKQWSKQPYRYDFYDTGARIKTIHRRFFHEYSLLQRKNPFKTGFGSVRFYLRLASIPGKTYTLRRRVIYFFSKLFFNTFLPYFFSWDRSKRIFLFLRRFYLFEIFVHGHFEQYRDLPFGANILGYLSTESGMGESARSLVSIFDELTYDTALINFNRSASRKNGAGNLQYRFSTDNKYYVNIVVVNGDQMCPLLDDFFSMYFDDRYNIAYWTWETEKIPRIWKKWLSFFNEIWVPSTYVRDVIAKETATPVRVVSHRIDVPSSSNKKIRPSLGIPRSTFLFCFMFDNYSFMERKNPLALIKAFQKAFPDNNDVSLLIKTINNSFHCKGYNRLKSLCEADPRIHLVATYLEREDVGALLDTCDCYVSLHRSEGFGLTIAESMARGKPVIVTDYSGNKDFTTADTAFLVKSKRVAIHKDIGPYKKGTVWSRPSIADAAKKMRLVYSDAQQRAAKAEAGQRIIRDRFSSKAISRTVQRHMERIRKGRSY